MSDASPRPWCVDDSSAHEHFGYEFVRIRDANGRNLATDGGRLFVQDAKLVVDAVNERDHLLDLVKRLAHVAQDALDFSYALCGVIRENPERAKARSEIEALLREAREAIGEETK